MRETRSSGGRVAGARTRSPAEHAAEFEILAQFLDSLFTKLPENAR